MVKKSLLILLLLLFCLGLVYSQDFQSEKQLIIEQLESIYPQLNNLKASYEQKSIEAMKLEADLTSLEKRLKIIKDEATKEYQILYKKYLDIKKDYGDLSKDMKQTLTAFQELKEQSEALLRKLSRLENQNKWLVGGLVVTGLVIIVESIILFAR